MPVYMQSAADDGMTAAEERWGRQVSRSIVFLRVGVEGRTNGDGSQFRATPDLISKGL